jgi:hypothetical protein
VNFESDDALRAIRRMWRQVGKGLAAYAVDQAAKGNPVNSTNAAKHAEAAFWQATGDNESIDIGQRTV